MKTRIVLLTILAFFLVFSVQNVEAQNWKKLTEKAAKKAVTKLNKKDKKKEETKIDKTQTSKSTSLNNNTKTKVVEEKKEVKLSLLDEIKAEAENLRTKNRIQSINDSKDNYPVVNDLAYFTFTNDFKNKNADMYSFTSNDFIYAKLNLNKVLTELLPPENASGLQYYRVKLIVKAGSTTAKSNLKLDKLEYFKLPYSQPDILFAIVPQKDFYESIKGEYVHKSKPLADAYHDIISRNFSSGISDEFQYLRPGEYKVEVELQITAKLSSSSFYKIKNIKGVFMLTVDENARQHYSEQAKTINKFYNQYYDESAEADAEKNQEKYQKMRKEIMDNYEPGQSSSNSYSVTVKNTNRAQSVHIIQHSVSQGSENIFNLSPGQSMSINFYKSQKYEISMFRQNTAKSSAVKISSVNESMAGKTITVK